MSSPFFAGVGGILTSVFGAIYPDGALYRLTRTEQPNGDVTEAWASEDVKVQQDACTEAQRQQEGYSEKDVRLIVLQAIDGVAVAEPSEQDVVFSEGSWWALFVVEADAVNSHWSMRGRERGEPV